MTQGNIRKFERGDRIEWQDKAGEEWYPGHFVSWAGSAGAGWANVSTLEGNMRIGLVRKILRTVPTGDLL